MRRSDPKRIGDYLDHILEAIETIESYVEDRPVFRDRSAAALGGRVQPRRGRDAGRSVERGGFTFAAEHARQRRVRDFRKRAARQGVLPISNLHHRTNPRPNIPETIKKIATM